MNIKFMKVSTLILNSIVVVVPHVETRSLYQKLKRVLHTIWYWIVRLIYGLLWLVSGVVQMILYNGIQGLCFFAIYLVYFYWWKLKEYLLIIFAYLYIPTRHLYDKIKRFFIDTANEEEFDGQVAETIGNTRTYLTNLIKGKIDSFFSQLRSLAMEAGVDQNVAVSFLNRDYLDLYNFWVHAIIDEDDTTDGEIKPGHSTQMLATMNMKFNSCVELIRNSVKGGLLTNIDIL